MKKLEKLRAELREMAERLDESLKFYGAHIHPLEQKIVTLRTTCVKIFFSFYKEKGLFSKDDKKALGEIIEQGLDEIFGMADAEPDDELKAIFKAINGVS